MDSVRPKRLKKRQTGRVGAVEAEFFNGLLADQRIFLLDVALSDTAEPGRTASALHLDSE